MKKIAYQTPEVKVKALFMDQLMAGSVTAPDQGIGWGGSGDGMEGDAKEDGIQTHSVWDD